MAVEAKGRNGTAIFDGNFVTVHREGFMARATLGQGRQAHTARQHHGGTVETSRRHGEWVYPVHRPWRQ